MADSVHTLTIKADADLSAISSKVKALGNQFQTLKMPKGIGKEFENDITKINDLIDKYRKQLAKGVNNKADAKALNELGKEIDTVFTHLKNEVKEINNSPVVLKADMGDIEKAEKTVTRIKEQLENAFKQAVGSSNNNAFNNLLSGTGRAKSIQSLAEDAQNAFQTGDIEAYSAAFDKMVAKVNAFKPQTVKSIAKLLFPPEDIKDLSDGEILRKVTQQLEDIKTKGAAAGESTKGFVEKLGKAETSLNNIKTDKLDAAREVTGDMSDNVDKLGNAANKTTGEIGDMADATVRMKSQMDQLKSSTEYFFGLRNMFNLLKRGIHQAIDTVRELDKAMTETAVVTDFSVGDMWSKLPLYTDQANQLGSTIKDVYEATTLYYQQGLDTNQAIGLANETLKMARIAGLGAAEATDAMTAALRGFNMEINEMSAQRINDVYSEIAAKTASDTEELSTAMSKTASLAHSAGMSFEGTTAFLAQMIETTREAPENLGTAMKTIIARFQEMKKNPLEIVDVEGEEVSYNKIDEALQSIGVSLKDANGQFRNLDEVFLEISSKWDSLTQTQQRYIATTAAGSRQQSRFIAMMSNYERVTQLVEYANDSAGASQEQFSKTLESFEAKVNKLKNAWQEYLMGITDNTILKKAIDLMTSGLGKVNKLIDTLSSGLSKIGINESVSKSIISLTSAFVGLKAAGRIANRAISGIGGFLDPRSSFTKGFFGAGNATGEKSGPTDAFASKIYTPITAILREISGKVDKVANKNDLNKGQDNSIKNDYLNKSFKERRQTLKTVGDNGSFDISEIGLAVEGLDKKQQQNLFNSLVGTKSATKRAVTNWFKDLGFNEEAQKQGKLISNNILKGMSKGDISVEDGIQLLQHPEQWATKYGEDSAGLVSKAFQQEIDKLSDEIDTEYIKALDKDSSLNEETFKQNYLKSKLSSINIEKTGAEKTADKLAGIGSAVTQAGYALSSFGATLSQINPALQGFGNTIQMIGGFVSSFGGILTGAVGAVNGLATAMEIGFGAAAGIVGVAFLAIAGIAALVAQHQKYIEGIHEAAQKVIDDYDTINKSTSENIAALKQYKDELAILSQGVDKNGYNVNLSTDEYDRYLEIVDKIAEINPDIVEGYNAQGHAIINNNEALQETLKLQEQIQKEALNDYVSTDSLDKLLKERNLNKGFYGHNTFQQNVSAYVGGVGEGPKSGTGVTERITGTGSKVALSKEVSAVVGKLEKNGFSESLLTKYGISSFKALQEGQAKAVKAFVKNQQKILKEAEYQLSDSWDKIGDSVEGAFEELSTATADFKEANQPVFQQVSTWAGTQGLYEQIPSEYRGLLSEGIYDIISSETDAKTIRKQTRNLVRQIEREFGPSSKYASVMEKASKVKEDFVQGLNEAEYKANIEPLIKELEGLQKQADKLGGAAGEALFNAYAQEIDSLRNFTESEAVDMMQALNPLSDEIAAAEGAFGQFQEATSSDFSTAAKNMKQFFDVLDDEEHSAGFGDKSFWMAAEDLFGEEAIKGFTLPEQVKELQESLAPLFEDGAEGYNNFLDYLNSFKDKISPDVRKMLFDEDGGFNFNFEDSNIPQIAEELGMSANTFTALLNKARQFSNIQFTNVKELRTALATSDTTVFGKSAGENEQQNIYVSREQLKNDAYTSGAVNNPEEWEGLLKDIAAEGIVTIPTAKELAIDKELQETLKSDLKISNIEDIVPIFAKMGFGKQDILEYGKSILGENSFTDEQFKVAYDDYLATEAIDPALMEGNQHLSQLVGITEAIRQYLSTDDVQNGYLTQDTARYEKSRETAFGESGVADTLIDFFQQGLDINGNKLDQETYDQYLTAINNNIEQQQEYLRQLNEGKDKTLDPDTRALYEEEIRQTDQLIKDMQKAVSIGEQSYQNNKDLVAAAIEAGRNGNIEDGSGGSSSGRGTVTPEEISVKAKLSLQEDKFNEQLEGIKRRVDETDLKAALDGNPSDFYFKLSKVKAEAEKKVITPVDADTKDAVTKDGILVSEIEKEVTKQVTADTTPAQTAVNELDQRASQPVFKTINATITGLTQKLKSFFGLAKGQNNYISPSGFYTGSAAKGTKGTLGPNGKGGMTLTGEEGFEVAWLPSENRSMILGAMGPQMVDLPSNAVVWNHEQSKKIVKQKGISIGSMVTGTPDYWVIGTGGSASSSGGSGSGSGSNSSSSSSSDKEKDPKHTNWYKEEITRYNLNQSINKIAANIKKTTEEIDKILDKVGTKYSDIANNVAQEAKLIKQNIENQKALRDSFQSQLNLLDKGGRSLWIDIMDSAGESSQKSISTSQFVYKDKDGAYKVDKNKVLSYAASLGGDANTQQINAEAIFSAISSEVGNLTSGLISAEQAILDYEKQLEERIEKISEAFFAWENELTKIYDLTQKISNSDSQNSRLTAETSMLFARVEAGFISVGKAGEYLQRVQKDSAKLIAERIALTREDINARKAELKAFVSSADEWSEYQKIREQNKKLASQGKLTDKDQAKEDAAYAKYEASALMNSYVKQTRNMDGTYEFDFNEEQLEKDRQAGKINEATYNAIKEGFDEMVQKNEELNEAIANAADDMAEVYETYSNHLQTMADLEAKLTDAFEQAAQREVSKLEALNTSLTNATKAILDQVKKNIQARRQAEDNAKTEGDIAKKQQRLAALRANTGGGNQVEIAQLEKEIGDAQSSYGRTLEDQLMANMQSQADEASKQRQEQIDLAKQQIDYNRQTGIYAAEADRLLENVQGNQQAIQDVLHSTQTETLGKWGTLVENNDIKRQVTEAMVAEDAIPALKEVITSSGNALAASISAWNGNMMKTDTKGTTTENKSTKGIDSKKDKGKNYENKEPNKSGSGSGSGSGGKTVTPGKGDWDYSSGWLATLPETNSNYFAPYQISNLQHGLNTLKWSKLISFGADLATDGIMGPKTVTAIKALQKLVGVSQDGIWGPVTGAAVHKKYPKYARGGLASKTGPAWLDGTPTKPELVLNAQDTKNFIALKDILSGVMRSISHTDTSNIYNSPTNFEINVNVEKIASDYDVDKLTERIKRNIVKDATYRNVTSVRKFK